MSRVKRLDNNFNVRLTTKNKKETTRPRLPCGIVLFKGFLEIAAVHLPLVAIPGGGHRAREETVESPTIALYFPLIGKGGVSHSRLNSTNEIDRDQGIIICHQEISNCF